MDPPGAVSVESKSKPEQTNEPKPNPKSYDCGLCDTEVVYKIAQELLPGLASACVDNTTGGLFKNAGSVAVDMRKEMSDYLSQRSETYVAEFLLSENAPVLEISEHPYDIIITLIDDFTALKRNMFSRVSEWVFSDGREDRIDDFVQEMEASGFWLLARRECIASILLKNVDYKNSFHCNTVCGSEEEAVKHRSECKFRPMDCVNEGCTTRYCAAQKENHEAVCPFMILPCEQKCSDFVMRREMDRHCVTICPMKLVNCAFYTVGCKSCIPRSNVQQHNVDDLSAHLGFIIRTANKDIKEDDLKQRIDQIRNLTNTEKLARARDARALTYLIKDAEAKLGPLESKTELGTELPDSPTHDDINKIDPPTETEPLIVKDASKSPTKTEPSIVKTDSDPPPKKEDRPVSPPANEVRPATEKPAVEEVHQEPPPPKAVESTEPLIKIDESKEKHESASSAIEKQEEKTEAPLKKEEEKSEVPLKKEEEKTEAPLKKEEEKSEAPLKKEEEKSEAPLKKEEEKSEAPLKKEEEKSEAPLKKEESRDMKEEEGKVIDSKEEERGRSTEGEKEKEKVKESVKSSMEEKEKSASDEQDKKKSSPEKEESVK